MAASAEVGTLVVGEALIDVVVSASETTEHVGGSPANVASGLATLDHPVALLTHVATDARGRRITEQLSGAGVRLSPGSDTADHTPTATARLDATGAATYEFDLDWAIPPVDLTGVTHLHTGSIAGTLEPGASQVLELAQAAREHATISYDPNLRPSIMGNPHDVRSRVEELVGLADVVKVSDEDLDWLYAGTPISQVAHLWGQLGPSVIVVTRGPEGALLVVPGAQQEQDVAAAPAVVIDTVGAGDSFMSGLLSGLLDADLLGGPAARERLRETGAPGILPAVQRALDCAHWTIERAGAAAPTRSDLSSAG